MRPGLLSPEQHFLGEVREAGQIPDLEALVGDQPALREDEDLDYAGLGGGGHDGLHALRAHDGPRQPYPLYPRYEVPKTRRGFELELPGEPLALPDQSRQMLLAALPAQERDHLVYHPAAVILLTHTAARRAAAHLAVEADALLPGAPAQGEDPAQGLDARVEHPGAPVRPEVDHTFLLVFRRHPPGDRVGLVQIEPYEPPGPVLPAGGVVAGQQALYLPGLQDEGVQLAL